MIKKEGNKWILYSKDGTKKLFEGSSKEAVEKREREIRFFKYQTKGLEETSIVFKATLGEDGLMRWKASVSDTSLDRKGEQTSLPLFKSWIEAIETQVPAASFLPEPRNPFLGISHYPSLGGEGEAGTSYANYIDGRYFKAKGNFLTNNLGKALFTSVRNEQDLVRKGETIEKPIKISAAWWDVEHSHGDFVFKRNSLGDVCPMCQNGARDKIYLKGQLDHYASTRVPISHSTNLGLQEKSMTKKIARKDDAESIIGVELAEELDKKARLVGKSAALVVKAKKSVREAESGENTDGHIVKKPKLEVTKMPKMKTFNGVDYTFDADKKAYLDEDGNAMPEKAGMKMKKVGSKEYYYDEEAGDYVDDKGKAMPKSKKKKATYKAQLISYAEAKSLATKNATELEEQPAQWDIFKSVADIIFEQENEQAQLLAVKGLISDFDDEVDTIKEAVADVYLAYRGDSMNPNDPTFQLKAQVDAIFDDSSLNRQAVEKGLQKVVIDYVEVLKAKVDTTKPIPVQEQVEVAVEKMMTPIVDRLGLLVENLKQPQPQPTVPQQKSFAPKGPSDGEMRLPVSAVTGQKSALTAMIRKSVGIQ